MEPFVSYAPWKANPPWVPRAEHHYYLGQGYHASGWHDRALKEADEAAKLEPRSADYHLLRAQILTAQEKTAEASKAAEKVLEYGPGKVKEVLALTEEFYTQQASVIYRRSLRSGSKEILPYLGLGNIALHRKEVAEAERWFRQAEVIQPKHAAVLLALGKLELAKRNYAKAVDLLEESKEKGEDSSTLYATLGEAYGELKQWEKSALAYESALKHRRKNTTWRLSLADALLQVGKVKEAEVKYREVLALDPNSGDAWKGLRRLGKKY
jgi:tetratricopeptide (TPR) repeat protein